MKPLRQICQAVPSVVFNKKGSRKGRILNLIKANLIEIVRNFP